MWCYFFASISLFHSITAPVVTMRESPQELSEVVSQAYFSEEVNVLEELPDWVKIETVIDTYQGWIKSEAVCSREKKLLETPLKRIAKVTRCMAHIYHLPTIIYGPILTVPFESLLEVIQPESDLNDQWIKIVLPDQREGFIQRGDVTFNKEPISWNDLPLFSLQFQGLPYTWGGRSSFGYDCSGFVQMLYRQIGMYLPRDSKDQIAWEGFEPIPLDTLSPGDLLFFGLDENKIRHVGMYLGNDQFIHSTASENAPYIHISYLSHFEPNKYLYRTARRLKRE